MDLKNWERDTLTALVNEDYDRAASREWIDNPTAWKRAAYKRKLDSVEKEPAMRKQLERHADRLGIGLNHPPAFSASPFDPHLVAHRSDAQRWIAVQRAIIGLRREHPLRLAVRETCKPSDKRTEVEALQVLDYLEAIAIESGVTLPEVAEEEPLMPPLVAVAALPAPLEPDDDDIPGYGP